MFKFFLNDRTIPEIVLDKVPCNAKPITIPETPAAETIVFKVSSNFKTVIAIYNPVKKIAAEAILETKFLTDSCFILLPITLETKEFIPLEAKICYY